MASDAEVRRRLREDFTVGVGRAGARGRGDFDRLAFQGPDPLPGVVPTAAEGRQQPQQSPQGVYFQAVDVQTAVVDARAFRYRHAAAVVAAVANPNVDGG